MAIPKKNLHNLYFKRPKIPTPPGRGDRGFQSEWCLEEDWLPTCVGYGNQGNSVPNMDDCYPGSYVGDGWADCEDALYGFNAMCYSYNGDTLCQLAGVGEQDSGLPVCSEGHAGPDGGDCECDTGAAGWDPECPGGPPCEWCCGTWRNPACYVCEGTMVENYPGGGYFCDYDELEPGEPCESYPYCDCAGNVEDCTGACGGVATSGCTNPSACNYNSGASCDDNSCEYAEENYNCDGSCAVDVDCQGICGGGAEEGCTNPSACNYNSGASCDDGSCTSAADNYDCDGNCTAEVDCAGECGGTQANDECGECDGDNSTCIDRTGEPNVIVLVK